MKINDIVTTKFSKTINSIPHLEDLLFSDSPELLTYFLDYIHNCSISIKWDGMPCVVFGRDSTGKLHIVDKHMFNKIVNNRLQWTPIKDYDLNRNVDRKDLWEKVEQLYPYVDQYFPKSIINKFYVGDLLWAYPLEEIDGCYIAEPNTVSYFIPTTSKLGLSIKDSVAGIALHGIVDINGNHLNEPYVENDLPQITFLSSNYFDKLILDKSFKINLDLSNSTKFINELISLKLKTVSDSLGPFIRYMITNNSISYDPTVLTFQFNEFLNYRPLTDSARKRFIEYYNTEKGYQEMISFWNGWVSLYKFKLKCIEHLDLQLNSDLQAKVGSINTHEGYVISHNDNNKVKIKLVDRLKFSAANFLRDRVKKILNENYSNEPRAVFCFGRCNPPTVGHAKLFTDVLELGKDHSFIFLSQTVDKNKNPLEYEEKIEFIKKILPNVSDRIVDSAKLKIKSPIHAIQYLYDIGYRNIMFVGGSDRLDNFDNSLRSAFTSWNNLSNRVKNKRNEVMLSFHVCGSDRIADNNTNSINSISASLARSVAALGDKMRFEEITSSSNIEINNKTLFHTVRERMGILEEGRKDLTDEERKSAQISHEYGTYSCLCLTDDSKTAIKEWCDAHNIETMDPSEFHCTLIYSDRPVKKLERLNGLELSLSADIVDWKILGNSLTLELSSPYIKKLHNWMIKQGATHSFHDYIPHVSIHNNSTAETLIPEDLPKFKINFNKIKIEGLT